VIGNVRISIAIFSYNGGLYFGVTGDYDSSNDIHILTTGVERSIGELLEVAGAAPAASAPGVERDGQRSGQPRQPRA